MLFLKIFVPYIRRITFRNLDERKDGASQIKEEAKKISEAISRISKVEISENSPCSILNLIAEVLRLKSTDIVSLEVSASVFSFFGILFYITIGYIDMGCLKLGLILELFFIICRV